MGDGDGGCGGGGSGGGEVRVAVSAVERGDAPVLVDAVVAPS
ncbi:hypothetical protein ABZ590_21070 [Streptomyces hirsutus]